MQVRLQEVAWTEGELPGLLARRNSRAEGALLQQEPMFCFEVRLVALQTGIAIGMPLEPYASLNNLACLDGTFLLPELGGTMVTASRRPCLLQMPVAHVPD